MNKLINIEISNNRLFLNFDNGGYIKLKSLDCFEVSIGECSKELNYIEFFETSDFIIEKFNDDVKLLCEEQELKDLFRDELLAKLKNKFPIYKEDFFSGYCDAYENPYLYNHRCLICSNGKAILLRLVEWVEDEDYSPFDILQRALKIIKENFEVCNVEENLENYENVELELKDVFIEFRKIYEKKQAEERDLELNSKKNQEYLHISTNKELFYNNLQKEISASDYDLILSYTNYNFDYLINNELAKPSKKLKNCVYNYLANYIFNLLKSKGFDLSIYKILFTDFKIKKCKKLLLKFDAEQIGPDHDKTWQISNFSFSTTTNGGKYE